MTSLELRIVAWHEQKYGTGVNLAKTYRKLLEEVGEIGQALIVGDADNAREEIGDVAVILFHLLRVVAPGDSLTDAMQAAVEKCERRTREGKA